jgi:hypothetical protein
MIFNLNPFGPHSPPLAALIARGSEPDVLLTQAGEWLTSPEYPAPWGGVLYFGILRTSTIEKPLETILERRYFLAI